MNKLKAKIINGEPLQWYELAATSAYLEAFSAGLANHEMSMDGIFRFHPNPIVKVECRKRGLFVGASGVRGYSAPDAKERKDMRKEFTKARTKWFKRGIFFDGAADRFQNSIG